MKTIAHKTLSAFSQLLCIFSLILTMITMIFTYYNPNLRQIENKAMSDNHFTFFRYSIYTMATNILIALFGGCVSSSGCKSLMSIFNRIALPSIVFPIVISLYFKTLYFDLFKNAMVGTKNSVDRYIKVVVSYEWEEKNTVIIRKNIVDQMKTKINNFIINEIIFVLCIIIITFIFKKMRKIKLYTESPRLPVMVELSKKGLNTKALNNIRVIDVAV